MFERFVKSKPSVLDEPIAKILTDMNTYSPDDQEFPKLIEHLERLYKMKAEERRNRVSSDAVLVVLGNLLGILIIVAYEQKHVMVSKGLGFVIKSKELKS